MKKETLKEIGKGFFGIANLVGGLSIVNGVLGKISSTPITIFIPFYVFIAFYIAGAVLINKGSNDD